MTDPRRNWGEQGYSLFEMLIVLAILALAAAVTMPQITRGRMSASGLVLERNVLNELQRVRAEAIRTNAVQWIEVVAGGRRVETSTGGRLSLAEGALIEPIEPRTDRTIRFYPDGRSSGGVWRISSASARTVVRIDWLTGQLRTERGPQP